MRGKHHIVTATDTFFPHPVFHRLPDQPTLGMPEDQPRTSDLLDRKQIKLFSQRTMITSLDLLQPLEVRIQILRIKKRSPIDSLQLLVLLIPQPVSPGDRHHLERLYPSSRRHMRPSAKIHKPAIAI